MTNIISPASPEAGHPAGSGDPNIRILHRVLPLSDFPLAPRAQGPIRKIALIDTETTGTDPLVDEAIDIAVVTIEVDAAGEIVGIANAGQALRDPGMPIPSQITKLTGLTDDDVRGKVINLEALQSRIMAADVRIAHVARFDLAFVEQLLPGTAGAAWACSATDFDWFNFGFDGRKLGYLLTQVGLFNDAHRAMADVVSLAHLLAHRLRHGGTVLGDLLASAERPTVRFEATAAGFEHRGVLKARGYRWDPRARVWWCEIGEGDCASEERWFRQHVAPHGPLPRMLPITWHQRHR